MTSTFRISRHSESDRLGLCSVDWADDGENPELVDPNGDKRTSTFDPCRMGASVSSRCLTHRPISWFSSSSLRTCTVPLAACGWSVSMASTMASCWRLTRGFNTVHHFW
ncbi:hypothetical protein F442_12075 [Phytophthora nicotianae P10297]|uniref:Uncharacterized protein n=1 Tax=Phytophthora nicotianae P10297 TaxID=1317064 RepID=W2Z0P2_PHYNI|nr:hypothetical protein F442_12075 [Phytophthora nicotianae P10297]